MKLETTICSDIRIERQTAPRQEAEASDMAVSSPPSALREEDYEAIEAAVMETSRGRWFLAEFARRNRSADTTVLLDAIAKLEGLMRRERRVPRLDRIQLDLADMQEAIVRTKREIAQIKHESDDGDRFAEASSELDAIINQTEGATQNILHRAEMVQELAWTLREQGVDEAVCDDIDAHTTEIFMACSFQDLTGQRTQKVVQVLRYLESRINEMMKIWDVQADEMQVTPDPLNPDDQRPDAHLLSGPQFEDKAIKQNDVDALMDVDGTSFEPEEAAPGADNQVASEEAAAAEPTDEIAEEEIDIDAVSFDRIDADETSEAGESETAAIDEIEFDSVSDADDDADGEALEVADSDEADTDESDLQAADAFPAAGVVLEDMLEESETVEDAEALVEAAKEAAAPQEPNETSAIDEDAADAAFVEMDKATLEEMASSDADEEADPLRALSAGERLALFS